MEGFEYYIPEGMLNTPEEDSLVKWITSGGSEASESLQQMQKEFMTLTKQEPQEHTYATLIDEEYDEWNDEYCNRFVDPEAVSPEAELKELADLVYVIMGYANCKGWDLEEAYRRVHQNNVGRCIQPDGTVKFREDNKVLKNKDYPKVDLSNLVGTHANSD